MNLECPHCHYTPDVKEWNMKIKDAVFLGVCDELIPEEIDSYTWDEYRIIHEGRCDCPECGEVVSFDDMYAY